MRDFKSINENWSPVIVVVVGIDGRSKPTGWLSWWPSMSGWPELQRETVGDEGLGVVLAKVVGKKTICRTKRNNKD